MVIESASLTAQPKTRCFTALAEIVFYNSEDPEVQTKQALLLKLLTSSFNTLVNDEESITVIG
jgi:hypothetical protein